MWHREGHGRVVCGRTWGSGVGRAGSLASNHRRGQGPEWPGLRAWSGLWLPPAALVGVTRLRFCTSRAWAHWKVPWWSTHPFTQDGLRASSGSGTAGCWEVAAKGVRAAPYSPVTQVSVTRLSLAVSLCPWHGPPPGPMQVPRHRLCRRMVGEGPPSGPQRRAHPARHSLNRGSQWAPTPLSWALSRLESRGGTALWHGLCSVLAGPDLWQLWGAL